jgi:structure-specific endonuclease subunit SLX1
MSAYCYLLTNETGSTYVGATVDVEKRLRQHNQELVGGARATAIPVSRGHLWKRVCYIEGIPEWKSALQIEWRWKQLGRTQYKHIKNPIERRLYALKKLLSLDKPTTKSIPYDAYPCGPPIIHWEDDFLRERYDRIDISL